MQTIGDDKDGLLYSVCHTWIGYSPTGVAVKGKLGNLTQQRKKNSAIWRTASLTTVKSSKVLYKKRFTTGALCLSYKLMESVTLYPGLSRVYQISKTPVGI